MKILDFGLAKLTQIEPMPGVSDLATTPVSQRAAAGGHLKPDTVPGIVLGTLGYMSPEQVRGVVADHRSDIFALGAILYEMLSGRRAFRGETTADTMSAILKEDPPDIPHELRVPPALTRIVDRCLEKSPNRRFQSAGDLVFALETLSTSGASEAIAAPAASGRRYSVPWRAAGIVTALLLVGLVVGATVWLEKPSTPARVTRLTITPSGSAALSPGFTSSLAVSSDGTQIVYVGNRSSELFVRRIDQLEPTALAKVNQANSYSSSPFLKPDGQWVGFFNGAVLAKVAITGGPTVAIATLNRFGNYGGAWGLDDTIVFATSDGASGLLRVPASGGEPTVLTRPNREQGEADHAWPRFLPGGNQVLFTIIPTTATITNAQIAVVDLRTGIQKTLIRGGSDAHYVSGGYLVYGVADALYAVPFNLDRLEVVGTPIPVVPQVGINPAGDADFDISGDGTLVYIPSTSQVVTRTLVWANRQGRDDAIKAPPRAYVYPRVSPDGTRIALDLRDQEGDIWIWDLARETLTRLTFEPTSDRSPTWTPDSSRIVYTSLRSGAGNLYWRAADGTGTEERLTQNVSNYFATSMSPDGAQLVFSDQAATSSLMVLSFAGDHKAQPLVQTKFYMRNGEISPDGRWLAYEGNDSGRFEIYVRPFPRVDTGRWQVSTGGGNQPLWSRDARELFYVGPNGGLMGVRAERGPAWAATAPDRVLEGNYFWGAAGSNGRVYDISPDGRKFLMIKPVAASDQTSLPVSIVVVQNWIEELKRLIRAD